MSVRDASNTHEVLTELFRAMRTPHQDRETAKIARYAAEVSLRERGAVRRRGYRTYLK